jgi:hypothetical protein
MSPPPAGGSTGRKLLSLGIWLGSSGLCFYVLKKYGYEGSWMPLDKILAFSEGPFQHRILFVLLASGIKALFPGFGAIKCFLLSQIPAILLAVAAVRRWAGLFVPEELAWIAPLLLAVLLVPTLGYYNFFDFGVVFFFAAGLRFLVEGRFGPYLATLAAGMLNHEVTILLVPIFMILNFQGRWPGLRYWIRVFWQGVICAGIRGLLIWLLPLREWPLNRILLNVRLLLHPKELIPQYLPLAPWYLLAILGIRHAPAPLKRCLALFPMLLATSLVFGQLNEVRLFDPFAPVAVALILCLGSGLLLARDRGWSGIPIPPGERP